MFSPHRPPCYAMPRLPSVSLAQHAHDYARTWSNPVNLPSPVKLIATGVQPYSENEAQGSRRRPQERVVDEEWLASQAVSSLLVHSFHWHVGRCHLGVRLLVDMSDSMACVRRKQPRLAIHVELGFAWRHSIACKGNGAEPIRFGTVSPSLATAMGLWTGQNETADDGQRQSRQPASCRLRTPTLSR